MKEAIPRYEWDFSGIPILEVEACHWWEYTREIPELLDRVERYGALRGVGQLSLRRYADRKLIIVDLTDEPVLWLPQQR